MAATSLVEAATKPTWYFDCPRRPAQWDTQETHGITLTLGLCWPEDQKQLAFMYYEMATRTPLHDQNLEDKYKDGEIVGHEHNGEVIMEKMCITQDAASFLAPTVADMLCYEQGWCVQQQDDQVNHPASTCGKVNNPHGTHKGKNGHGKWMYCWEECHFLDLTCKGDSSNWCDRDDYARRIGACNEQVNNNDGVPKNQPIRHTYEDKWGHCTIMEWRFIASGYTKDTETQCENRLDDFFEGSKCEDRRED